MFARSAKLLKRGGLLFGRVNSASTDVYHSHRVVERAIEAVSPSGTMRGPSAGWPFTFCRFGS